MAKPTIALVITWRDLAEEGHSYAEIARRHPDFTVNQIRHYCLGNAGKKLPGPIQRPNRWNGEKRWLQGENSPHAQLTKVQAIAVLDDWDEDADRWGRAGKDWAKELGVSPSTIHMLRRGETWKFLGHPNQGRKPGRNSGS